MIGHVCIHNKGMTYKMIFQKVLCVIQGTIFEILKTLSMIKVFFENGIRQGFKIVSIVSSP